MARTIGIGIQDFSKIRENDYFYIDKTGFIKVMLMPKSKADNAIIIEFKVYDVVDEKDLQETVKSALKQIEEQKYEEVLISQGIPAERIRKYGFAFEGKKVLIG